jgi:hypothetical protein
MSPRRVAGGGGRHRARRWGCLLVLTATLSLSNWVSQGASAQDAGPGAELPAAAPSGADAALPPEPAQPSIPKHSLLTAIEVEPGATCLAADKLVRRVERWLNDTKVDARIRVRVIGDESEPFKVSFSIDRGDGHAPAVRRIDDAPADCDQLHSALALSIALAIDASILGGSAAPSDLPDDETLVAPKEPPAESEPRYFRLAVAALGQLSTGLLTSDLGLGAEGRVEVGFVPWLDVRVGALFAAVGEQRVAAIPGTFDATIVAGRVDLCGAYSPAEPLRLLACGTGVLGQFRTVGHDYTASEAQVSLWSAAGGGLEAQALVVDRLAFALSIDLLIPFARRTILVVDSLGRPVAERDLTGVGILIGVGAVFRIF